MKLTLPLAASTGQETDYLLLGLVGVSVAVLALVFGLMFFYVVRYRHNSPIERGALAEKSFRFEIIMDGRHADDFLRPVHLGFGHLRPSVSAARRTR